MYCPYGVHLESRAKLNNRFQRMQVSHPKQYAYCMDKLGFRDVLGYMGIPVEYQEEPKQLDLFIEEAIEVGRIIKIT